ncbi:tetratricopeptide repeat protein [PVC group bacterium]|nr:tetratricopeptide repeat protein [PVC group bacterium]
MSKFVILFQNKLTAAILIVICAILAYLPSLHNQFAFDDISTVLENEFIRDLKNIPHLLSPKYFEGSGELSYRPVVTLTYFFDYAFYDLNPLGYHIVNILLHCSVGFMVFLFITRLGVQTVCALFGALLFVLHPVNSEPVNCIAFREDLLCGLFYLGAFLLFSAYQTRPRTSSLLCGSVSLVLALFSKEMAVSFVFVYLLYIYFIQSLANSSRFKANLKNRSVYATLCITAFYVLIRFGVLHNQQAEIVDFIGGSRIINALTMPTILIRYFQLFLWPDQLSIVYLIHHVKSIADPFLVIAIISILILCIAAWKNRKRNPLLSFCLLATLLLFLPVANIMPIRHPMAERYMYIPSFALCLCAAGSLGRLSLKSTTQKYLVTALCIILLAVLGFRTHVRSKSWYNNFTLWKKTTETVPLSSKAHYSLGHAWQTLKSDLNQAVKEYEIARDIDPLDSWIRINLGMAYKDLGRFQEAEKEFLTGLAIEPDSGLLYYDLGILYGKMGFTKKEERAYRDAIKVDAAYADAYDNLAVLLATRGEANAARELWLQAIIKQPKHIRSLYNLGNYYANHGDLQQARAFWQKVLKLSPRHSGAKQRLMNLKR